MHIVYGAKKSRDLNEKLFKSEDEEGGFYKVLFGKRVNVFTKELCLYLRYKRKHAHFKLPLRNLTDVLVQVKECTMCG